MAIRRPPSTFSDELTASDLAANSVGASELADNAVDTAAIADDAVTNAKMGANAITATEIAANAVGESELSVDYTTVKPHIIPGVLYPSYVASGTANKLLDGTTNHSGAFGTAQSDGRKYYYTNIAGSKPIKDPRIGTHFGSQRHKVRSIQLLEQETATHGKNVYSIDGREWIRAVGGITTQNDENSHRVILNSTTDFVEIVGYFSDLNYGIYTGSNRTIKYSLDGANESSDVGVHTKETPLFASRYVDASSKINLGLGATLGIHTIKLRRTGSSGINLYDIELIAHDTSNVNEIKIPKQNVVSYGKKFEVGSDTLGDAIHPHHNPFAQSQTGADVAINSSTTNTAKLADGWSGTGATYYSSELDTATSLGLSAWESGGDFYRPVNGGRVVWWVNSSGSLKCSVNMMPPAGTAIGGVTGGHNVPTGTHNWATKYQPALHSTTIDQSQAEVAKTFHFREFGNGAANEGSSTSGTKQDASMLNVEDDIAYVMDDGLTALTCNDAAITGTSLYTENTGERYITFIGTGISVNMKHSNTGNASDDHRVYIDGVELFEWDGTSNTTTNHIVHYAQNLPYGTHILKIDRLAAVSSVPADNEYTFFQPKMPPVPEDACIIADYMLMADFVQQTTGTSGFISKGVRFQTQTRDLFYTAAGTINFGQQALSASGWQTNIAHDDNTQEVSIITFAKNATFKIHDAPGRVRTYKQNGTTVATTKVGNSYDGIAYAPDTTLQNQKFEMGGAKVGSSTNAPHYFGIEIATPIHTSSHYQSFETPFLHELVGGDRNMEQNNLVCSPAGKTWDEVTRDTSYISNICLQATRDGGDFAGSAGTYLYDLFRGNLGHADAAHSTAQKNFAIAYDRFICLVDGHYKVTTQNFSANADRQIQVMKNSVADANDRCIAFGRTDTADFTIALSGNTYLKRGDYISVRFDGATFRGLLTHFTFISIEKI